MYSSNFDYYRATSLADARQLMAAHPGSKLLAGGHSLVPLLKLRLSAATAVIDICRIAELRGIARHGAVLRIGALTTHAELAASADVRAAAHALAEGAEAVGDPAVRNRGTIGGNIAHADPASDLPTVLVALDARMVVSGPNGDRTVPADQFFTGIMTTALEEYEILVAVEVPAAANGQSSAYEKFSHPASRYAVLGAAALVSVENNTCTAARVAIGGLVPSARRLPSVERAMVGRPASEAASAAAEASADLRNDVTGDIFASAAYRSAMAPVYVKRALTRALQRVR